MMSRISISKKEKDRNHKVLLKEIKEDLNKWRTILYSQAG